MSGPELQLELIRRKQRLPIVFVTAHAENDVAPRVMERGAIAFLFKPFGENAILDAVNAALGKS